MSYQNKYTIQPTVILSEYQVIIAYIHMRNMKKLINTKEEVLDFITDCIVNGGIAEFNEKLKSTFGYYNNNKNKSSFNISKAAFNLLPYDDSMEF